MSNLKKTIFNIFVTLYKNRGFADIQNDTWFQSNKLNRFSHEIMSNSNNVIIVGKNTWLKMSKPYNKNIFILSKSLQIKRITNEQHIESFNNVDSMVNIIQQKQYSEAWVCGGLDIYKYFIDHNIIDNLFINYINDNSICNHYFPPIPEIFFLKHTTKTHKENIFHLVYTKIKKHNFVTYKNTIYKIKDIHYDDLPNLYFTISNDEHEVQTVRHKLKLT